MEKQRHFDAADSRSFHVGTLSGQDSSDIAGDLGGLDSADGAHLFVAARSPISPIRARALVLGFASDLYDQPVCRKDRSRCSAGAFRGRLIGRARLSLPCLPAVVGACRMGADEQPVAGISRLRRASPYRLAKCKSASRTPAPCSRWAM